MAGMCRCGAGMIPPRSGSPVAVPVLEMTKDVNFGSLCSFCLWQVDMKDDKGCTPALAAAMNGHVDAVQLLVDRFDAKVSIRGSPRDLGDSVERLPSPVEMHCIGAFVPSRTRTYPRDEISFGVHLARL